MKVTLLWHMHQPYYVDPLTRIARMPWVRLHCAKGYLDMIEVVRALPELRVNFNFTPVLIRQILELVEGRVVDEWEALSRKPATHLTDPDKRHLLENFFKIHWDNLVKPYPRYAELLAKRGSGYNLNQLDALARKFSEADFRDLQTLYNLHWCGFSALKRYPALHALKERGRDFTEEEKLLVLDTQHEILKIVLNEYRQAEEQGQIELTTTPYFHPIMPLVYDTEIARRCQPHSPLPSPFTAPEDVRSQLRLAQEQHARVFGKKARGLWPSEGSIAPEIIPLLVEAGIEYFCSDEGNLFKSLEQDPAWNTRSIDHLELFQGWRIRSGDSVVQALFRERPLSDFIGFDAAQNETARAVEHLIASLKHLATIAREDRGIVSIILDGENAWEAFPDGGEAFLTQFYDALVHTPELQTVRLGDYFDAHPAQVETSTLHSGSWIRSDYDIWIGDPEENKAWEWLKETRTFLMARLAEKNIPRELEEQAWWEIYAAEGSDWFWWYGDDFTIDTDFLFDELFRLHLQNVYRILGLEPPSYLQVPICTPSSGRQTYILPSRLLQPALTGETDQFFDWVGAGEVFLDVQQTAMFQSGRIGLKLLYGFGHDLFYLRLDLRLQPEAVVLRFIRPQTQRLTLRADGEAAQWETSLDGINYQVASAAGIITQWKKCVLIALPRVLLKAEDRTEVSFYVEIMEHGLQRERYPERGAIEFFAPGRNFEAEQWFV